MTNREPNPKHFDQHSYDWAYELGVNTRETAPKGVDYMKLCPFKELAKRWVEAWLDGYRGLPIRTIR